MALEAAQGKGGVRGWKHGHMWPRLGTQQILRTSQPPSQPLALAAKLRQAGW